MKLTPWIITEDDNLVRYFYTGEYFDRDNYYDVAYIISNPKYFDFDNVTMLADAILASNGYELLKGFRVDYKRDSVDYMGNGRDPDQECYIISENEESANDIFEEKQNENYYFEDRCQNIPEFYLLDSVYHTCI